MSGHRIRDAVFFFLLLLAACGGGGGNNPFAALQGTWFGTLEDPDANLFTLQVTIDGAGNVTELRIDNVDQGVSGPLTLETASIFFALLGGIEVGLYVDPTRRYAVFLSEEFDFGVLEKGATNLPPGGFVDTDLYDGWSGTAINIDNSFQIVRNVGATLTVDNDGSFLGTDIDGYTFEDQPLLGFSADSSQFGLFLAQFMDASPTGFGHVAAVMSPDKNFIAVYACELDGSTFPTMCSFRGYTRQ